MLLINTLDQMKEYPQKGFTIIELLLAVALMTVIVSLAAPGLGDFLDRRSVEAQSIEIADMFSSARARALSRGETVSVCWNNSSSAITETSPAVSIPSGEIIVVATAESNKILFSLEYTGDDLFVDDNQSTVNCVDFDSYGRANTPVVFGVCRKSGDTTDMRSVSVGFMGRATIQEANTASLDCS